MAKTKINSERETKVNLSELTNIPSEQFEKHFRDWMERDDVARSLQAKLRTDLITNFNKTALGKHILAQTTTTTGGGVTQRLTLCPLTLVLNTLVAEFLYAGNCHFTLSVFCTEVPYRNTLPDFESMRHFRFNEQEISEILTAVTGDIAKSERSLVSKIAHEYEMGTGSLLLYIVQMLLERIKQQDSTLPAQSQQAQLQQPTKISQPTTGNGRHVDGKDMQHEFKMEVYNSNFRYLNKYLIILSKKVNEMTQQFQSLQQNTQRGATTYRSRMLKSTQTRKFENLNRSLERITENLKLMSHAKRRSKHIGAIVTAIEGLALQFTKCAANFENVSRSFGGKTVTGSCFGAGTANKRVRSDEKQTETDAVCREEKSYLDWIQEMRNTINGQKFLDRIEIVLRKALSKQRDQLSNETDMKLRHQKELLKIRYKQKLMEELTKHGKSSMEHSVETYKINANIEKKLQQFEQKHFELLHKIHETEVEIKKLPSYKTTVQPVEKTSEESSNVETITTEQTAIAAAIVNPTRVGKPIVKATKMPTFNDSVNTQKQLQQIVKNMAMQERTVDHIVYDAKLRIQELENESNQLEQSFLNYLERQRLEKENSNKITAKVWDYYALERDKMWQRFKEGSIVSGRCDLNKNTTIKLIDKEKEIDDGDLLLLQQRQLKQLQTLQQKTQCDLPVQCKETNVTSSQKASSTNTHHRNAILEAKEMFFESKQRYMKHAERQIDFISVPTTTGSGEDEFDSVESVLMLEAQPKQISRTEMSKTQQMSKLVDFKDKVIEENSTQAIGNMRMRENYQAMEVQQMQFGNEWDVKQSQTIPERKTLSQYENVATINPKRSIATTTLALNQASLTISATTNKNATVLKETMAKMQLLFNSDPLAQIGGSGKEQKMSTTISSRPKSSLIANNELPLNTTEEQSVSAVVPYETAAMLNTTTSTISVISSVASVNTVATITESTSVEQKKYPQLSVLGAISLPPLNEPELPAMGLNMSNEEIINEAFKSSSCTNGDNDAASIEVAAVFHAANDDEKNSEELDEVVDVEEGKFTTDRNESPEVGEIVEKSSKTSAFVAIERKLPATRTTSSSDASSIELQLSMTNRRKHSDSDSDFWA